MRRRSRASSKPTKARSRKAKAQKPARHSSFSAVGQETKVERLTRELRESLERQVATSDVLGIIGSSPGELGPVFQAMLENAVRICEAKFGHIYRWNGDVLTLAATHNTPPAFEACRQAPYRPGS